MFPPYWYPYLGGVIVAATLGASFWLPQGTPFWGFIGLAGVLVMTKRLVGLYGKQHVMVRLLLPTTLLAAIFLAILSMESIPLRIVTIFIAAILMTRILARLTQEGALPLPERARDMVTPSLVLFLVLTAAGVGVRGLDVFLNVPASLGVVIFTLLASLVAIGTFHLQQPGGTIPKISAVVFALVSAEMAFFASFFPWSPVPYGFLLGIWLTNLFFHMSDGLAGRLDRNRIIMYNCISMICTLAVLTTARWFA